MRGSLIRIAALTRRNVKEILRDPLSLIFMLAMPLVMLVLFYVIFHKLTPQFEMRYLAPGVIVFAQSFLTLFTGLLISVDRSTAFLTRLYVTPARSYEFISGYTLAMLPVALIQSVIFFIAAGVIDPSFFTVNMIWGALMSVVTSLLFIGFGILFGSLCNEKSIGGVASIVVAGQSVLSGMWFPLEGIDKGVINVMNALPFRPAAQLMQHIVSGASDPMADIVRPLIIVLAYAAAVYAVGVIVYNAKMKKQ